MSVTDKMWDSLAKVIRMDDKVERLAGAVKGQQARIEKLTVAAQTPARNSYRSPGPGRQY